MNSDLKRRIVLLVILWSMGIKLPLLPPRSSAEAEADWFEDRRRRVRRRLDLESRRRDDEDDEEAIERMRSDFSFIASMMQTVLTVAVVATCPRSLLRSYTDRHRPPKIWFPHMLSNAFPRTEFARTFRMSRECFARLVDNIPRLQAVSTPHEEVVALAIYRLAHNPSFRVMSVSFGYAESSLH